jgi:serine/threonine protein kinase
LSGLSPFVGGDDFETMTNVSLAKFSFDYQPFDDISEQAKDFIEKLLVKEPSKRLTAKNSLNHEWLTNCTKMTNHPEHDITLSLTKTKLKRYVILRRLVEKRVKRSECPSLYFQLFCLT